MPTYGLLGRKLSHSHSPQIHRLLGGYDYDLFEREPEQVVDFVQGDQWLGLNVTIPYKIDVLPLCHHLTDLAKRIGCVNTIIRDGNGKLTGHNTDYFGFDYMLQRSGIKVEGKKVLILGDGGSARTVRCVLEDREVGEMVTISREGENNYKNIARHANASVIINTTPVGMYPNVDVAPIDLDMFPQCDGVLDLIYNPKQTKLLRQADSLGISATNGLPMLVAQGAEAVGMFVGKKVEIDKIEQVIEEMGV